MKVNKEGGSLFVRNKASGEEVVFSLDDINYSFVYPVPKSFVVCDEKWVKHEEFSFPDEFHSESSKAVWQVSRIESVGHRIVANTFGIDIGKFRAYIFSFAKRKNRKFKTKINKHGEFLVIRLK